MLSSPHAISSKVFSERGACRFVADAAQSSTDVDTLRSAPHDSKRLGNFKNLLFYAPNGKPGGVKIVPLSEIAPQDDFFNIQNERH